MMSLERYLPIGTICNVQGYSKKIMIIGYFSVEYNGKVKMYDYKGCDYPEGLLLNNKLCSFNNEDIVTVDFEGFVDDTYNNLNNNLLAQNNEEKALNNYSTNSVLANIEFDENGVVIYDPLVHPTYKSEIENIKVNSENPDNLENPFVPIAKGVDVHSEQDASEWSIFKNIQFDENGVVIVADEYTPEELNKDE